MTRTRFQDALNFVMRWEGGLADHPNDPGGRTMKGVTQRTYDRWRADNGLPMRDVAQIEDAELEAIYEDGYWSRGRCDRLRAQLDLVQFDTGVNMGPNRAIKILQTSVGASPDGQFGPRTEAACDDCELTPAITCYCDIREGIYRRLAQRPGQNIFLTGWLNRLDDLRAQVGVPGFSPSRSGATERVERLQDLGPNDPLEVWQ